MVDVERPAAAHRHLERVAAGEIAHFPGISNRAA